MSERHLVDLTAHMKVDVMQFYIGMSRAIKSLRTYISLLKTAKEEGKEFEGVTVSRVASRTDIEEIKRDIKVILHGKQRTIPWAEEDIPQMAKRFQERYIDPAYDVLVKKFTRYILDYSSLTLREQRKVRSAFSELFDKRLGTASPEIFLAKLEEIKADEKVIVDLLLQKGVFERAERGIFRSDIVRKEISEEGKRRFKFAEVKVGKGTEQREIFSALLRDVTGLADIGQSIVGTRKRWQRVKRMMKGTTGIMREFFDDVGALREAFESATESDVTQGEMKRIKNKIKEAFDYMTFNQVVDLVTNLPITHRRIAGARRELGIKHKREAGFGVEQLPEDILEKLSMPPIPEYSEKFDEIRKEVQTLGKANVDEMIKLKKILNEVRDNTERASNITEDPSE